MYRIFFPLCFFVAISLHAQTIKFNPKIGIGGYDFNLSSNSQDVDAKAMFTIGSDIRIGSGAFFINTGAHYSVDGYNNDANTFQENGSINFIRIPANLGLYLTGRDGILVIYVKGGITNNFFLSASGLTNDDIVKKYNLAGNLGLGFDIFKFAHLSAEYDKGLSNYFDTPTLTAKKSAFLLSLGLVF